MSEVSQSKGNRINGNRLTECLKIRVCFRAPFATEGPTTVHSMETS